MAKTDPIDPAVPAGSDDPKLGDNRIRELARAVAEILNKDHYIGADGGSGTGYNEDAAGEHNKVTLRATTKPTAVASKGFVYGKDVSGKIELFYEDEDGTEIQITTGGILNSCNLTGNQTIAGIKTFSSQPSFAAGLTAAAALISTLADGTAPLSIISTTKVANLNVDKVDGYDIAAYAGAESYTFPGGMIIKQGLKGCSFKASATNNAVTFAAAFPNACKGVILTLSTNTVVNNAQNISAIDESVTGFNIRTYSNNTFTANVAWLAIGY